jgi:hypothetical protein
MSGHSPQHTGRFATRQRVLQECFAIPNLDRAWKRYVRDGMRNQVVSDLHDYHEFHRNRRTIFQRLKAEILEGRYRPRIPVMLRLEKKPGLTRRICIPSVYDAVVLQALTDYIYPSIRKKQPSENSVLQQKPWLYTTSD